MQLLKPGGRAALVLPDGFLFGEGIKTRIKEKLLAAKRAGIKEVILCVDNKKDVEDIKPDYLKGLTFHYVTQMEDVLKIALLREKVK